MPSLDETLAELRDFMGPATNYLREAVNRAGQTNPVVTAGQIGATLAKPLIGAAYQSGQNLLNMTQNAMTQGAMYGPESAGPVLRDVANVSMLGGAPGAALAANSAKGVLPVAAASVARPFFSQVAKTVADAPLTSAPASQWLGTIKNAPGVKPEELDWTGLEDWLKEQKGQTVTKSQVSNFVDANQVNVQDVVKGEGRPATPLRTYEQAAADLRREHPNWPDAMIEDAATREHLQIGTAENRGPSDTKFSQYQLPGGENYKELLLTMPNKDLGELKSLYAKDNMTDTDSDRARALNNAVRTQQFTGGHYPEDPNTLVHVRFNDRTDVNGKKTLFLEELQSDWHQKGRKQGYANDTLPGATDAQAILAGGRGSQGVPNAPFKSSWPDLALKRMVKYAADNGYDQIAWTPGDVQAARYDLSKQIDQLNVFKNKDGTFDVQAYKSGANSPTQLGMYPAEKLPDVVGKELADKIVNDPRLANPGKAVNYEGLDLKVGGEGMKGFYDKMLPAAANKLFNKKQFGNAKVGVTKINIGGGKPTQYADFQAWEDATKYGLNQEVHTLPITDAMRSQAVSKGFPLFSTAPPMPTSQDRNKSLEDQLRELMRQ